MIKPVLYILCLLLLPSSAMAEQMDSYQIGRSGKAHVKFPAWFKESFFNLQEDLDDARQSGKKGIIAFFSQENCSHCKAFLDTTFSNSAIQKRVRKDYDVVGLEIFSDVGLTEIDGTQTTIKNFAEKSRARLTPTLIFYDAKQGQVLKIVGFYPPEKFGHVLDYVEGGHYQQASLGQYLRGNKAGSKGKPANFLFDYSLFDKPPYLLDRHRVKAQRMLMVLFEIPDCSACQRFHNRVLADKRVQRLMKEYDTAQLNMADNSSKLITPAGHKVTPRQWADELKLAYDVAVVFFDEQGKEVHRLDSETGQDRMTGSLQYVQEKAYQRHEQYQRWRKEKALQKRM